MSDRLAEWWDAARLVRPELAEAPWLPHDGASWVLWAIETSLGR